MRFAPMILVCLCFTAAARGADSDWQRIVCIDDPRITITLLLKSTASPADEEFVGWELNNRTGKPLPVGNLTHYQLDNVMVWSRAEGGKPVAQTNMASGNSYDLLWRNGRPLPPDGPRPDDLLPPGVTRCVRYASTYSFATLGVPAAPGHRIEGRAHFAFDLTRPGGPRDLLTTPADGVAFRFEWLPPDDAGIVAMQQRLKRALTERHDPFEDAFLIGALLKDPRIASAVSVLDLLAGLKQQDTVARPGLRAYIDDRFPAHEQVITFFKQDAIEARNRELIQELSLAPHIRDRRLIDPLMKCARDGNPPDVARAVLVILARHRELMPDRKAITTELGRFTLARTQSVSAGTFPKDAPERWAREVSDLVLTGDAGLVKNLVPYLDQKQVVEDATFSAMANHGVSTRACDAAYNAILDLLERPGNRFSLSDGALDAPRRPSAEEYARRDALIATLKTDLSHPGGR